ncbi:MAG: NADH:ubiquinone oxidoreductase [Rhodobacteraceae bacterium]|nr:MAG: NADH:ubiquinone oxidoreductase [Paracoccaceae bacterium]
MKNAPPLYGWAIACAAGLVGGAVSFLLVGIEGNGSVAIAGVVTLLVGLVFTIAERPAPPAKTQADVTLAPATSALATPAAVAAPTAAMTSAPVVEPAATAVEEGTKPTMLSAPVGAADDLKAISGVGPVLETKLNEMGVYHFWQIARWSDAEVAWVDGSLNFKGRIERDGWIAQAKTLAEASPAKPPA